MWVGFLIAIIVIAPSVSFADQSRAYRLVHGDVLQVSHPGSDLPVTQAIDLDGNLRLPDVGAVRVVGYTMEEAARALKDHIDKGGLFVDPRVALSVTRYAPVIVAGEIANPGRIEFHPGLTVATALALSQGAIAIGPNAVELSRAEVVIAAQIDILDLEIATTRHSIAELQARLSAELRTGTAQDDLGEAEGEPATMIVLLDHEFLLSLQANAKEAGALRDQGDLLNKRIDVQRIKTKIAAQELKRAEALKQKGLQTSDRLANLQRREADARSELLNLESNKTQTAIALTQVEAARMQSLARRKATLMQEIRMAERSILTMQIRRASLEEQLTIVQRARNPDGVSNGDGGLLFKIQTTRLEHSRLMNVGPETRLMPGDTLIVGRASSDNG